MCLSICAYKTGTINAKKYRKLLDTYIMKDLIISSLQKRRIYRKNRTHSLRSKPGCKSNSMFFCNTNIKKALWIMLFKSF